jgi:ferric-chelate reductase (NADPH)
MDSSTPKQARSVGRVEGAIMKMFTKAASVSEVEVLDESFRLITLAGPALRDVRWVPGMKVQMGLGGWISRTYTPIDWDAANGLTRLLAFVHGDAPGAVWARGLRAGEACTIFGPRDSIDLTQLSRPGLLFGDESSIGLAHALRFTTAGAQGVSIVLEVTSKPGAEAVLARMQIEQATLVERKPDDAHLSELEELVAAQVQERSISSCALSGKATSIQRVNKRLRALGMTSRQIRTKAYWAPGKAGLD